MLGSPNISDLFHPENHKPATLHWWWPLLFANTTQVPVTAALCLSDKIQLIRRRKRATSVNSTTRAIMRQQVATIIQFIPHNCHNDSYLTPIIPHKVCHTRKTHEEKSQKASAVSTGRWQHCVKSDEEAKKGNK